MAYLGKDLSVLAYANGFTLWHYTTPDPAPALTSGGYFNDARELLRPGDMILTNSATTLAPVGALLIVAANRDGAVGLTKLA